MACFLSLVNVILYILSSIQPVRKKQKEQLNINQTRMDMEWLHPEQIEQILKFCELASVEDLAVAANILEQHSWNLENAVHDVVQQNDQIHKQQERKKIAQQNPIPRVISSQRHPEEYQHHEHQDYELAPEDYHHLDNPNGSQQQVTSNPHSHTHILSQQNNIYAEMERNHHRKRTEQEEWTQHVASKQAEYENGRAEFVKANEGFDIKFRLAHKIVQFGFSGSDKVEKVFRYVNCCLRDGFEHRYGQFDLSQAFPPMSLKDKQDKTLEEIFGQSNGEVLIVKEV